MKRWLSILAVFGCIVALSGCKNENEKRQAYFNAKVLEINKEYVDVRCIEAFNSGISVDEEFSVANYAQTECQFRYCGTAIPFLTVRSTAR